MGFGTNRFVNTVDPNLMCGVCRGVLEGAVLTSCGHTFCHMCLRTWLARPAALTCPECRAPVSSDAVNPVHALRNLIGSLEVRCDHAHRGCKAAVKLDLLAGHLSTCDFAPVQCAGCGQAVSKLHLPEHQMDCPGIAASVRDNDDSAEGSTSDDDDERDSWELRKSRTSSGKSACVGDVLALMDRIRALESRVERLLGELRAARTANLDLEREYKQISEQLREKRREVRDLRDVEAFLDRNCSPSPETMAQLSLFIARNLLRKPRYVEVGRAFEAIQRCYDRFQGANPDCEHDMHMLLATAYASNWFSPRQRLSISCWLCTITRPGMRVGSTLLNR